jgi:hypothetical protein
MNDLQIPDQYGEQMVRVLKYGMAHVVPVCPEAMVELLLEWCAAEEKKMDELLAAAEVE